MYIVVGCTAVHMCKLTIHTHTNIIIHTHIHIHSHRGLTKKMRFLDYNFDKPFHADKKRDFVMVSTSIKLNQIKNPSIVHYASFMCFVL